ncbi:unnamed protein product [Chondrus crispus]|uniref:ApaG domain-containing protein n=1 Tax=Chondrus crispus TaxID=2769 RepID=R7QIK2_CHOCR|nr:unnamed protein product [Chondrus crispus]CDF37568.1 unnamed protein product [Chondrus crispus]|eukprot:XP_005717439.1 unnamed protein product [Chondrus crispus]
MRDRVAALQRKDAHVRLKRRLEAAVKEQRFRAAARLRDALRHTTPPPIVLDRAEFDFNGWRPYATKRVNSCKVSNGVCVEVESFYDVERSGRQERGKMAVFGVRVRVRNEREEIVQLVGRRWCIESYVVGGRKEVEGWGVGGERRQPVLEPGEEFVFETAVPVTLFGLVPVPVGGEVEGVGEANAVVVGACSGAVEFVSGDCGEDDWEADVGECFLVLPG